jgi:integrase
MPAQDAPLEHQEWLNAEDAFPHFEFARTLRDRIGDDGTVYIWSPYERTVLREIRQQMDRYREKDDGLATWLDSVTQEGSPRVVDHMTHRLEEALAEWKGATGGGSQDMRFGAYGYRSPFERAKKLAGLGEDVVCHTLRHTYIARLTMGGVDLRTVQDLAGHKTITMTMRYAHLAPEHKRRAVAVLNRKVSTNSTTSPLVVEHKFLVAR